MILPNTTRRVICLSETELIFFEILFLSRDADFLVAKMYFDVEPRFKKTIRKRDDLRRPAEMRLAIRYRIRNGFRRFVDLLFGWIPETYFPLFAARTFRWQLTYHRVARRYDSVSVRIASEKIRETLGRDFPTLVREVMIRETFFFRHMNVEINQS